MKKARATAGIEITDSQAEISDQPESSSECAHSLERDDEFSGIESDRAEQRFNNFGLLVPRRRNHSCFSMNANTERP